MHNCYFDRQNLFRSYYICHIYTGNRKREKENIWENGAIADARVS